MPVPVPRTPLVGRDADVRALLAWLAADERLVTVTGPVGIGKTRIAIEVARAEDVAERVVFADMSGVTGVEHAADAIRRAADLSEESGARGPLATLGRALKDLGSVLLVLDSAESLATIAGSVLAPLFVAAPELVIMVVSRERTRLAGEVVHEVAPLPEATELFIASAQRVRAGYAPRDAEREAVDRIVLELDGVPLALELAAARLSVMSARALLHRLRAGDAGVLPALDRSVAATFASLTPELQEGLCAASVFRGSFTLEAAEAVLASGAGAMAIEIVTALRDRSLLLSEEDASGEVRLRLPRAVKAFAERRLETDPHLRAAAMQRHAEHFASFADACARLHGREARERVLREEQELLLVVERVVAEGAVSAKVAEPALRAMLGLAPLLFEHRPLRAYEALIDPALAKTRDSGANPALLAAALVVRGAWKRHRGDVKSGARDLVQALGIAKTIGDGSTVARATMELGFALADAGDADAAIKHLADAADALATRGDVTSEVRARVGLAGLVARAGDLDGARQHLDHARRLASNDPESRAPIARELGALELSAGQLAAARTSTEEALALAGAEGREAGLARMQLGLIAQRAGDRTRARAELSQASAAFADLGLVRLHASAEAQLGHLAREEGLEVEAVARLRTAQRALAEVTGAEPSEILAQPSVSPTSTRALTVAAGGQWFSMPDGDRVGLERRAPMARILERLVEERLLRPDTSLSSHALSVAAWPGEKILPAAAAHRVRVAISALRKLGLPIVTGASGYALDASLPVTRA